MPLPADGNSDAMTQLTADVYNCVMRYHPATRDEGNRHSKSNINEGHSVASEKSKRKQGSDPRILVTDASQQTAQVNKAVKSR